MQNLDTAALIEVLQQLANSFERLTEVAERTAITLDSIDANLVVIDSSLRAIDLTLFDRLIGIETSIDSLSDKFPG